jgi:hypothetical protein
MHELKEIIEKNWNNMFNNIFQSKDRTLQMLEILSRYRNRIMHGAKYTLLLYQNHLCLGIAGEILLIVDKWRLGFRQNVKSYECHFLLSLFHLLMIEPIRSRLDWSV